MERNGNCLTDPIVESVPVEHTATAAAHITRGVGRLFDAMGLASLTEFILPDGRRVDVVGMDRSGCFTFVEIKSSLADYRADGKWHHYLPFCDAFYFAVAPDFPRDVLPDRVGTIVADRFEGAILRTAPSMALAAARRRALLLRFARTAAKRLATLEGSLAVSSRDGESTLRSGLLTSSHY